MTTIHENGRETLVRVVIYGGILACAAGLYFAWVIAQTYGLSPGDGGVLRPLSERLLFGGIVAAIALAVAGGLVFYGSLYVISVETDPAGDRYRITTLSMIGPTRREFPLSDFTGSAFHRGRMVTIRAPSVNAPWITLRVSGRRLPFILDAQAHADPQALSRIAPAAAFIWGDPDTGDDDL